MPSPRIIDLTRAVNAIDTSRHLNQSTTHSIIPLYCCYWYYVRTESITDTRPLDTLITRRSLTLCKRSYISTWWRKNTSPVYFSDNSVKNRPIFINWYSLLGTIVRIKVWRSNNLSIIRSGSLHTVTSEETRNRRWEQHKWTHIVCQWIADQCRSTHKTLKFVGVYLHYLWAPADTRISCGPYASSTTNIWYYYHC